MEHFPYEEHQAGVLKDNHETGKSSEALLADEEVILLAKELLPKNTYVDAENLAINLTQSKSVRDAARAQLVSVLPPPPKRPIYYLEHELPFLPRWTRNSMRFLGDYIDMLVKAAAFEKRNDRNIFENSFGPAIREFKKAYPAEGKLADYLSRYNRFLYKGAKHEMKLPSGRKEHRFTSREVVLTLFISKELGDRLVALSPLALKVKNDQPMT